MKIHKRICMWCGKNIPNFRQKRARTCSIQCMHAYSHAGLNERNKRKIKNKECSKKGDEDDKI